MKIGIDVGGSHIGVGLINGQELIETVDQFFTEEDKKDIENSIVRKINELIDELLLKTNTTLDSIESIGVAAPGTISEGKITSWNLGLKEFDLVLGNHS